MAASELARPGERGNPVVVVDDLHVTYRAYSTGRSAGSARSGLLNVTRGIREVKALRGVSFVAYENESIGVIGANGSGKSTLMRAVTGLTPPASGAVRVPDRTCWVWERRCCQLSGARNIVLGVWPWAHDGTGEGVARRDRRVRRT